MGLKELIAKKREEILSIASRHGAKNVRLFGSAVRGEETPESDVDFLVEFEPDRSLLDHIAFIQDLEDLLGCKVDVVTESALHWYVRPRIISEAVGL